MWRRSECLAEQLPLGHRLLTFDLVVLRPAVAATLLNEHSLHLDLIEVRPSFTPSHDDLKQMLTRQRPFPVGPRTRTGRLAALKHLAFLGALSAQGSPATRGGPK